MRYFKYKFSGDGKCFYYKVKDDYSQFWRYDPSKRKWLINALAPYTWNEESTKTCTEISEKEAFIELL